MEKLIDANVILRYLLNDNIKQADAAAEVIRNGAFTLPEVIAEVVYVLTGVYKVKRQEITDTLLEFLKEISIHDKPVIIAALQLYSDTVLDYVDCVLIARNTVLGDSVFSFDKKLNRYLKS